MTSKIRSTVAAGALVFAFAIPVGAQQAGSVMSDLVADVSTVEKKLLDLARAIPADKYEWRPGAGVRTVGEVVMHVSADNYLMPAALGVPADPSTGIKGEDYKTALAYEQRKVGKDAAIAELAKSFAHLRKAMTSTPANTLGQNKQLFGQTFTVQQTWIMATTHLHEHLGQMIAYARSNGVVPPWSK